MMLETKRRKLKSRKEVQDYIEELENQSSTVFPNQLGRPLQAVILTRDDFLYGSKTPLELFKAEKLATPALKIRYAEAFFVVVIDKTHYMIMKNSKEKKPKIAVQGTMTPEEEEFLENLA